MKKLYFIIIGISLVFMNCSRESAVLEKEASILNSLRGEIKTYDHFSIPPNSYINLGSLVGSTFVVYGTSSIDANGNFNVTSFKTPDEKELTLVSSRFVDFKISNPSAKIVQCGLYIPEGNNKTAISIIKAVVTSEVDYTKGDYMLSGLIYSDQNVRITGEKRGTSKDNKTTFKFNLELKAGWNAFGFNILDITDAGPVMEVTAIYPEGGIWFSPGK
jgi:hypothetical protein